MRMTWFEFGEDQTITHTFEVYTVQDYASS